jgi:hypothetical protein
MLCWSTKGCNLTVSFRALYHKVYIILIIEQQSCSLRGRSRTGRVSHRKCIYLTGSASHRKCISLDVYNVLHLVDDSSRKFKAVDKCNSIILSVRMIKRLFSTYGI